VLLARSPRLKIEIWGTGQRQLPKRLWVVRGVEEALQAGFYLGMRVKL
jgi:hypothetical protein